MTIFRYYVHINNQHITKVSDGLIIEQMVFAKFMAQHVTYARLTAEFDGTRYIEISEKTYNLIRNMYVPLLETLHGLATTLLKADKC